ncbi:MAG: hypothetical protein NE327_22005 [Lentisphaeraceae bacterium]|nr:hypothetical protein [Lentisphaeraceae bacterium]
MEEQVSSLSCEEQGKLKKYEHFDFEKYQHLRRVGELEDAKKASRLKQEIQREELLIDDLLDMREELLKEKEKLLEELKKIKEEEDVRFREKTGRSGIGEPHTAETESGDFTEAGRLSADIIGNDSGSLSKGGYEQSESGSEYIRGSNDLFSIFGRDNGGSFEDLEAGAGSGSDESVGGIGSKAWQGIKDTAKRLWEYLYKSDLIQKLNPFREKKVSRESREEKSEGLELKNSLPVFDNLQRTKTQKIIESVKEQSANFTERKVNFDFFFKHIKNDHKKRQYKKVVGDFISKVEKSQDYSTELVLLSLFDQEAKEAARRIKPSWKDKFSSQELVKIENKISELESNHKDAFFDFKGMKVLKRLKSIVIAREISEGRVKRNVIINFYIRNTSQRHLMDSTSQSAVDGVRDLRNERTEFTRDSEGNQLLHRENTGNSFWVIFEKEIEEDRSTQEALENDFSYYEIDENLKERLNQLESESKERVTALVRDLKREGLIALEKSFKPSIIRKVNEEKQDQNRGRGIGF